MRLSGPQILHSVYAGRSSPRSSQQPVGAIVVATVAATIAPCLRPRSSWRSSTKSGVHEFQLHRINEAMARRQRRKEVPLTVSDGTSSYICHVCGRVFRAKIGLISHLSLLTDFLTDSHHHSWWTATTTTTTTAYHHTKDQNCGLRSLKLFSCWSVFMSSWKSLTRNWRKQHWQLIEQFSVRYIKLAVLCQFSSAR